MLFAAYGKLRCKIETNDRAKVLKFGTAFVRQVNFGLKLECIAFQCRL